MNKLTRYAALTLVGLCVGFSSGCRKKPVVDRAVVEGAAKLPGATEVEAAIDRKDYDGAVAGLMKIRQAINTEEQSVHFRVLAWQSIKKISGAAVTNTQAAEAVNALRALTTGVR